MKYDKYLKGCSKNFKKFFDWSVDYLNQHGKILNIRNVSYLRDGGRHTGSCDGSEIIIAGKCRVFEEVYAHEFAHMLQAVEKCSAWLNISDDIYYRMGNGTIRIQDWDNLFSVIKVERDCERRTLELSTKWGLFDNETYTKNANTYMYFYQYVFIKNKWISTDSIYIPDIVKQMPSKLITVKNLEKIDMNIMKMFDKAFNG